MKSQYPIKPIKPKKEGTSWGNVADWYDKHLSDDNTFHAQVIAPNLERIVSLKANESMLELGCGQGYFIEKFSYISPKVTGVDVAKQLIEIAQTKNPKAKFMVGNAEDPKLLPGQQFDVITVILAIQNMRDLAAVAKNLNRLLKKDGKVVIVLNHPAFRVPQYSGWGTDPERKVQHRAVATYMSEVEIKIDMTPGKSANKEMTLSYHRPLQVYSKAFSKEGFGIVKIEEWISHKKSVGLHAKMEDHARKEIPLFMCLVLKKI